MFDKDRYFDLAMALAILALIFLFAFRAIGDDITHRNDQVSRIERYIKSFFGGLYPTRQAAALSYIPAIVVDAEQAVIDPLLVAVVISYESAWKAGDVGPLGEKGLMQIKPRPGLRPPEKPLDSIRHGVQLLASAIRECGSVLGGLSKYQSGRCAPVIRAAKFRYRKYQEAKGK